MFFRKLDFFSLFPTKNKHIIYLPHKKKKKNVNLHQGYLNAVHNFSYFLFVFYENEVSSLWHSSLLFLYRKKLHTLPGMRPLFCDIHGFHFDQRNYLFYLVLYVLLQLWDIRDGMCKQTFSGHESDINAITVSIHIYINVCLCVCVSYFI